MNTIGYILSYHDQKNKHYINKIKFTNREIEVIVCLVNGRSVKKIALLLSISCKTVEVHIRNIMLKLECNSREKIIDFVELSQERAKLIDYYKLILEKNYFNLSLKKIKPFLGIINEFKIVVNKNLTKENNFFIHSFEEALSQINIHVSKYSLDNKNILDSEQSIYIVTNEIEKKELELFLLQNGHNLKGLIVYLNTVSNVEIKNFYKILVDNKSSFFLMVLEILYTINLQEDISKIKNNFAEQLSSLYAVNDIAKNIKKDCNGYLNKLNNQHHIDNCIYSTEDNNSKNHNSSDDISKAKIIACIARFFKKQKKIFIGISVFLILFLFGFYFLSKTSKKLQFIQTDLLIPSQKTLIIRNSLLKKITSAFAKNKNKIKKIIIIGVGGIGKTTIARHYALNQNNNIVWEINAETEMELIKSFEHLAVALAKTKEIHKELEHIYTLHNIELFKNNLMIFIQRHLFNNPNWLLIYDNVDNFNDIISYLPHNANIWGIGKVLILTRNQNIVSNKYIDNDSIIYMPDFSFEEKEKLFLNIYHVDHEKLDIVAYNKLKNFLAQIPSFPLDVTTAAYFLKNTSVGYDEYLKNINNYGLNFRSLDANILKDTDNIFKTRYNIVVNTLQRIINYNNNFRNQLLFISMLRHNDIPLELLYDSNEEKELSIEFLRELSRYSFINYERSIVDRNISLHKSVHNIIYLNLREDLHNKSGMYQIDLLTKRVVSKLSTVINNEDIIELRSLLPQAEILIKNRLQYNKEGIDQLKYQIGKAYRYLGQLKEAINILEDIKNFKNNIEVLLELGTTYKNIGEYHKSCCLIEKALNLSKKQYGSNSIQTALVEIRLDTPYRKLKKYMEAKRLLEHSLKIHENHENRNIENIAWICTKLGHLSVKLGYLNESIMFFEKSLKIQTDLYSIDHIRTAWTYVRMANAYKELKKYDLAIDLFKKGFQIYNNHYGRNHTKTAWVLCALGEIEGLLGNFDNAEKKMKEALAIQKQYYGEYSIRITWTLNKLLELYKKEKMFIQTDYYSNLINKIKKGKK